MVLLRQISASLEEKVEADSEVLENARFVTHF